MNNEVIKRLQIKNGKLQIQIERLKLDKEEYYLDYLKLQQRIAKAIEYINYSLNNPLCDEREALKQTLDILRGEDNESN